MGNLRPVAARKFVVPGPERERVKPRKIAAFLLFCLANVAAGRT